MGRTSSLKITWEIIGGAVYLGGENKSHDGCGAHKEPQTEHGSEYVEILNQGVCGDYQDSPQQAGDVDSHGDIQGIV